jgi:hypothetical protein
MSRILGNNAPVIFGKGEDKLFETEPRFSQGGASTPQVHTRAILKPQKYFYLYFYKVFISLLSCLFVHKTVQSPNSTTSAAPRGLTIFIQVSSGLQLYISFINEKKIIFNNKLIVSKYFTQKLLLKQSKARLRNCFN